MKKVLVALVLLFALPGVVLASTYEERLEHGRALVDQLNQVRSPNIAPKYLFYKVADIRAEERAAERDATGTSEFPHDPGLQRVQDAMQDAGWCYHWVGEVVGYSNQLNTTSTAAIADSIIDRWQASDDHWPVIGASSADWGGGAWVRSESGTYFFIMYVADICGV